MQRLSVRDNEEACYDLLVTPRNVTCSDGQTISSRQTRVDTSIHKSLFLISMATAFTSLVVLCFVRYPIAQQSKVWKPVANPISQFNDANVIQSNTAMTSSQTSSDAKELSDAAFQGILKQYRLAMHRTNYQVWLPLVLRGDMLLIARKNLMEVRGRQRFKTFVAMMRRALNVTNQYSLSEMTGNKTNELLSHFPLVDGKWNRRSIPFIMTLGDHKNCERTKFPRFGWCTTTDTTCTIYALPTFSVYREAPLSSSSSDSSSFHERLEQNYPWSSKKAQAVWRGSATGPPVNQWYDLPRARLVNFSILHPTLLDAAFTHAKQLKSLHPDAEVMLRRNSRFADFIRFPNFQKYRAVVDIDGNSWSNRFGRLLCMNSAVIKVQPSNENYFFGSLQPWVHYIPVAANMSDMVNALVFATSNETQVQVRSIVHSANEFCRIHLTKDSMARDIAMTLGKYLQLLGTNETRWRQWDEVLEEFERIMDLVEPEIDS